MRRAEVIAPGQIDQLRRQLQFSSFEETDVVDLVQQITRFASFHDSLLVDITIENVAQARFVDGNTARSRRALKNFCKRRRRRRLDARSITHAAQKCFVHEISFLKVRGEHNELLKRHFDLLSAVQREKVDATFERQYPAIQQILRRNSL